MGFLSSYKASRLLAFPQVLAVFNAFTVGKEGAQRIQNAHDKAEKLEDRVDWVEANPGTNRSKSPLNNEATALVNNTVTANVVAIIGPCPGCIIGLNEGGHQEDDGGNHGEDEVL